MQIVPHSRPWISTLDKSRVDLQLASGQIAWGKTNQAFEEALALYLGYEFALTTGSGSVALKMLLRALDIGFGDSVVLPTYVCSSVLSAVVSVGAEPVLCDTSHGRIMSPKDVSLVIRPNTKAIVLVHMFGIDASDLEYGSFGVPVIDDLCQAFGLKVSNPASVAGFASFNATKCLTTGEGGGVLTNNKEFYEKLLQLRIEPGFAGLSDLSSALGLSQLERYPLFIKKRRWLQDLYSQELPMKLTSQIPKNQEHPLFRYPLTVEVDVEDALRQMGERGVIARRGVDSLLHRSAGMPDSNFPGAILTFDSTVSIPFHASLSESEISRVLEVVRKVFVIE